MAKIRFLFVLHNHQPCDNFGWVFEDAFKRSYEPFISVLEKYPRVKVAMHYSGSLLEWLEANKYDFVQRLKALVNKRQIELLTGGFYEPILPVIPDNNKIGQVNLLTDFIRNYYGYIPKGVWITERVWQGSLSDIFLKQGFSYTVVDENHLKRAGISENPIHGYYELKNGFKIFTANKRLRYIIPFAKVRDVVAYFKGVSSKVGDTCLVFADDGEKFGFWPQTYDWVYKKKWLENFFKVLSANNDVIEPISFSQAIDMFKPRGVLDEIPPSSYSEMMEWAQGDFNNFFKIYPEANLMRNRMLYVSDLVRKATSLKRFATSREKRILKIAERELYMAQSGCAYWHGIFGGLYLNHLRSGVYKHLINAQKLIEQLSVRKVISIKTYDVDDDLDKEVVLGNRFIDLYIKPGTKGELFELDSKEKSCNIVNTLARRRESYHSKLLDGKRLNLSDVKKGIANDRYANIHDILGVKCKGLKKMLIYDDGEKNSFSDYFVSEKYSIKDFANAHYRNILKISKNPYRVNNLVDKSTASYIMEKEEDFELNNKHFSIYIKKVVTLSTEPSFSVTYTFKNLSKDRLKTIFATECNWSLMKRYFLRNRTFRKINSFIIDDEWMGIKLEYLFSEPVRLWTVPIHALNESESGLEKTYQHLRLLIQKPISLGKEESAEFSTTVSVG